MVHPPCPTLREKEASGTFLGPFDVGEPERGGDMGEGLLGCSPLSRVGPECNRASPQKIGPCGVGGRSEYLNEFRPGETIRVAIRETIDHPSHYRISFNPDGDAFYDPQAVDDIVEGHPYVLLDGIPDENA
jgi:hypothetical protein